MSGFVVHAGTSGLAGPVALGRALATAGPRAALVLLALEGTAGVERQQGLAAGEELRARAAAALAAALVAAGDRVIGLTGDELAVVLDDVPDGELIAAAAELAETARAASGCGVGAGAVSAVLGQDGAVDVRRTVRDAGLALRAARRSGSQRVSGRPDDGAVLTLVEEEDLEVRTSLRSGEFELHFQPLVDPSSARPLGIESLVRGRSATGGPIGPGGFLPQVRRSGLSVELGTAILADALGRWAGGLRTAVLGSSQQPSVSAGGTGLLAVNVDAEQVEQEGFDRLVLHLLSRAGVAPDELVLEVTEAVLNSAGARARLQRLRDSGVRIAIDDFGAGPVVLSEISQLPVDILKVDQVLVGRLDPLDPDMGLIEDLQRLAGILGLQLAVEAVESSALATRIASLGVAMAQGYHYARPMPPADLMVWFTGR